MEKKGDMFSKIVKELKSLKKAKSILHMCACAHRNMFHDFSLKIQK